MDELVPPVVTTKPTRGREMQTTTIPTDMFDSMRMMSVKRTLGGEDVTPELQRPADGTAEYYHEGYVDGKLYLVPDSNLEAMKDIINFKMRPRRSTRYKHQTSYELSDYDHFRGKLDGLFSKLDNIQDLQSDPSDENKKNKRREVASESEDSLLKELERLEKESKYKYEDQDSEDKYEDQDSEYKSDDEDSEVKSEAEDSEDKSESGQSKEELKQKSHVKFEEESDVHYLRFLVSGHFKKDQKPIYIIQEYNGEPDLFKNQKADFFSKQKDGNVDVFISGKFYNENILEESDGKPVALMTKPDKITIQMDKSKVYYDYFKDIYNMKNFDISFKGEFIKSKVTNRITPFLTLGVEKRAPNQKLLKNPNYETKDKNAYNKNRSPATVLIYEPQYYSNTFSQDVEYNNGDIEESYAKEFLNPKQKNEPLPEMLLTVKSPSHEMNDQNIYNDRSPATVLVYEPKYYSNPFSQDEEYKNGDIKESSAKEYLHPEKSNEPLPKTDPPIDDNSSQEVATHFFSMSYIGEDVLGEGIVNEPINTPFKRPNQVSPNQSDVLSIKKSAEVDPVSGETLNTPNTPNAKKSLKEGFLKTFLKGNSLLKTLFEKKPSKDNFEINKKTQNTNVTSTQSITNTQQTPNTEKKPLENKNENTPKNKIKSILHLFK